MLKFWEFILQNTSFYILKEPIGKNNILVLSIYQCEMF